MKRILVLAGLLAAGSLHAQVTAVAFGSSNLVNLAASVLRDGGITHTIGYDRPFSTGRMNPNLSQYFGPEFYGGFATSSNAVPPRENFLQVAVLEGPAGPNSWPIVGGVDALNVQYRSQSSADLGLTYRFLILFRIAEGLTLGPDSTLSVTLKRSGGNNINVRPVFAVGSPFSPGPHYAFNTAQSVSSTSYTTLTFTGLTSPSNWLEMATTTLGGSGPSYGSARTEMPSTVTSIGFLFTSSTPGSGFGDSGFQISAVNSVLNAAIPEPAAAGVLAGLGTLGLAVLLRRRR